MYFLVLCRYHDQLVATEAKFPIAENQVIVTHYFVITDYVWYKPVGDLVRVPQLSNFRVLPF